MIQTQGDLTEEMVVGDSLHGSSWRLARTDEERQAVYDRALEEWNRIKANQERARRKYELDGRESTTR